MFDGRRMDYYKKSNRDLERVRSIIGPFNPVTRPAVAIAFRQKCLPQAIRIPAGFWPEARRHAKTFQQESIQHSQTSKHPATPFCTPDTRALSSRTQLDTCKELNEALDTAQRAP